MRSGFKVLHAIMGALERTSCCHINPADQAAWQSGALGLSLLYLLLHEASICTTEGWVVPCLLSHPPFNLRLTQATRCKAAPAWAIAAQTRPL